MNRGPFENVKTSIPKHVIRHKFYEFPFLPEGNNEVNDDQAFHYGSFLTKA